MTKIKNLTRQTFNMCMKGALVSYDKEFWFVREAGYTTLHGHPFIKLIRITKGYLSTFDERVVMKESL